MSMGGLLASALGGAASSGMAMADKVATEEKAWDREKNRIDLQQRRDITLEGIRAGNAEKLQTDRQTFQGEQNKLNRQAQLTAANISASSRATNDPNSNRYTLANGEDLDGNKMPIGSFDKSTGEMSYFSNQGSGNNQDLLLQANAYADSMIDELSGTFSSDSTDFKEFGGSRTKAHEYHKQAFLKGNAVNTTQVPPLEPIVKAKPSFSKEKAQSYLNSLNNQ